MNMRISQAFDFSHMNFDLLKIISCVAAECAAAVPCHRCLFIKAKREHEILHRMICACVANRNRKPAYVHHFSSMRCFLSIFINAFVPIL